MNCEIDIIKTIDKVKYINVEFEDLTFKVFNLIIIFFIIFIIYASIALLEIKIIFNKLN